MSKVKSRRRLKYAALALVLLLALVALHEYGTTGTYLTEIDVRSGRIRRTHTFAGILLSQSVVDTEFSILAARLGVGPGSPPEWVPMFSHRPHIDGRGGLYVDYAAGFMSGTLDGAPACMESAGMSDEARKAAVLQLLEWMRRGDADSMDRWETRIRDASRQAASQTPPAPDPAVLADCDRLLIQREAFRALIHEFAGRRTLVLLNVEDDEAPLLESLYRGYAVRPTSAPDCDDQVSKGALVFLVGEPAVTGESATVPAVFAHDNSGDFYEVSLRKMDGEWGVTDMHMLPSHFKVLDEIGTRWLSAPLTDAAAPEPHASEQTAAPAADALLIQRAAYHALLDKYLGVYRWIPVLLEVDDEEAARLDTVYRGYKVRPTSIPDYADEVRTGVRVFRVGKVDVHGPSAAVRAVCCGEFYDLSLQSTDGVWSLADMREHPFFDVVRETDPARLAPLHVSPEARLLLSAARPAGYVANRLLIQRAAYRAMLDKLFGANPQALVFLDVDYDDESRLDTLYPGYNVRPASDPAWLDDAADPPVLSAGNPIYDAASATLGISVSNRGTAATYDVTLEKKDGLWRVTDIRLTSVI